MRGLPGYLFFAAALFGLGAGYFFVPVNPDEGAIFDFAAQMLEGKTLYRDLIDVNPPLIFLLNLIPAAVARAAAIPPALVITAFFLLLFAGLQRLYFVGLAAVADTTTAFAALNLIYVFIVIAAIGAEFSQREHLVLAAFFPYVCNLHRSISSRSRASLTRRAAEVAPFALLICVKPHFVIPAIALEAYAWRRLRRRAGAERYLEQSVLILAQIAMAAITILAFPDYITSVVGLSERRYNVDNLDLLRAGFVGVQGVRFLVCFAAAVGFGLLFCRNALLIILAIAAFAFYLASALQLKDWPYHFIPANGALYFLIFASCLFAIDARRRGAARLAVRPWGLSAAIAVYLGFVFYVAPPVRWFHQDSPRMAALKRADEVTTSALAAIVSAHARDQRILWLSQYNDGPSRVGIPANARVIAPVMSLWPLASLYERHEIRDGAIVFHAPAEMSEDERWVLEVMSDAFVEANPPVVISIKDNLGVRSATFDFIAYFSINPTFRDHFSAYTRVHDDTNATAYVRSDVLAAAEQRP